MYGGRETRGVKCKIGKLTLSCEKDNEVHLKLKPNEKHKIRAKCKRKILCKWEIYASTYRNSGDFIVKKYHPFHRFPIKNKNKYALFCTLDINFKKRLYLNLT